MDGKNIADFVDPDIEEKLEALEREEEKLIAEGFYDNDEEMVSLYSYLARSWTAWAARVHTEQTGRLRRRTGSR